MPELLRRNFADLVDEFRTRGKLAFSSAALVRLAHGEAEGDPLERTFVKPTERKRPSRPSEERSSVAPLGLVFPVYKREGTPFDHIGTGRAESADVCLPFAQISRFHAYFYRQGDDSFMLADGGSSNGTWIGARQLAVRTPTPLHNGERVRFGPYHFLFLSRAGLLTLVEERAR
ncbi:MAG: hypothetical protein JWN04_6832 [Myxococcaceae bacterium]|nr:hypothetical protein [Myxococcaceae bacterium]